MIDRLYKLIQTISNNELNGNISPQEFNLELHSSVEELYEENVSALHTLNKKVRYYGSFELSDQPSFVKEKINHYYAYATISKAGSRYPLPEDFRFVDYIEYNGFDAEPVKNRREFKAITNYIDTSPSTTTPIYLKLGNELEVAPASIVDDLEIFYYRQPQIAKWTYTMVGTTEVFNPDAPDFADVDIHPSDEHNLAIKLLQKLGINLKEPMLSQYGISKDQLDFQKENS